MAKKTWLEKFNVDREPVVEVTDKTFADIPRGSRMLIATPKVVDEYIRQIPKGVHTSLQQMRKDLALNTALNSPARSLPVFSCALFRNWRMSNTRTEHR